MQSLLLPLHDDGAELTQVFVHGYEAARTPAELRRLAGLIGRARPSGDCYLLCWGAWLDGPDDRVAWQRLLESANAAVRQIHAGDHQAWLRGLGTAASETLRFWSHAAEAERVGRELPRLLDNLPQRASLRLWGHSLGARLLLSALQSPGWAAAGATNDIPSPPVQQAVLMGAAVEADVAAWTAAKQRAERLINVHSSHDLVLRIAPLWTPLAGLRAVDAAGVENLECQLDHNEYWRQFAEIQQRVGCAPSDLYQGAVLVPCPACDEEVLTTRDQPSLCPGCGLKVHAELRDGQWRGSRSR
ncbi:MAG: DUF726 domain-containing protein [Planctomycetales bacterium]|nr:DUF726 domain-containing protein [Planctomycetales bacterium]